MKIVVLDGYALNPGDISWEGLRSLGELTVYERTSFTNTEEIIQRIGEAEIVLTNKTPITHEVIQAVSTLKYIGVLATGYNVVDLAAAAESGIAVTNIPAYGTDAVAQHTFALLLEIANQVGIHNESVHQGEWVNSQDFMYSKTPLIELSGKVFGLVGYGAIAQATARIAHAFNMQVIYYNHREKPAQGDWDRQVALDELFHQADVVSLHVPETDETRGMIDLQALRQMKSTAILLNTARGGLLNELEVAEALNEGRIAAAGIDVLSKEPMQTGNPLLEAKHCVITPHIAWAAREARERLMAIAVENVASFITGKTKNVVTAKK
ncbi:glycerate dehydrogenase [Enterococcus florum]|uniref:Glycerate dehydrogenase n=1 Tax=Enterococcus florum TaxID=2480627 RepID=A0A4V0WPJ2_9ENTE|nr:D-2-hydroxyacid dehydrogenase [Enterococcus florum]GCF94049.1 glycerate dehydrogenase [Enterococcus florum]